MYIKLNNEQPETYTIGQLRKDNPNTSFPKTIPPATLEAYGMYPVFETPKPTTGELEVVVQNGFEKDANGNWVRSWAVRDMFSDQLDENGAVVKTKADQESEYLNRLAEQKMKTYKDAVQNLLDTTAKDKGYDSIISMCTYASSSNTTWAAEGQAAVNWRDACWNQSLVEMGNYLATGVAPTMEDFLAAMPTPNWPA